MEIYHKYLIGKNKNKIQKPLKKTEYHKKIEIQTETPHLIMLEIVKQVNHPFNNGLKTRVQHMNLWKMKLSLFVQLKVSIKNSI